MPSISSTFPYTTRPACHLSAITPTVAIVATGPCRFFPSTLRYYYFSFFFSPFGLFGVSLHGMTSSIQDIVLAHRLSAIRASPFSLLHTYSQRGIPPLTLIDLLVLYSTLLSSPSVYWPRVCMHATSYSHLNGAPCVLACSTTFICPSVRPTKHPHQLQKGDSGQLKGAVLTSNGQGRSWKLFYFCSSQITRCC